MELYIVRTTSSDDCFELLDWIGRVWTPPQNNAEEGFGALAAEVRDVSLLSLELTRPRKDSNCKDFELNGEWR